MSTINSGRIVGYARVSAEDQVEHGQVDALRHAGISEIITEKASGIEERPLLDALVASLTRGDTLAVTEVSRLGRTTAEVLLLADDLRERDIHLRILNLGIDTATPAGGLVITMTRALNQASQEGHAIDREVLATFNPYRTEHLNRFGKYALNPNRIPEPLDFEMEIPMAA